MTTSTPVSESTVNRAPLWLGLGLFGLALALRLPYLGDYMTIDEVKWIEGAGQFLVGLHRGELFQTYWHFFPGITITWGEAIILYIQFWLNGGGDLTAYVDGRMADLAGLVGAMRLSGAVLTSLCVAGVFWLSRPLFGERVALLAAALLAADPFFVGHSRIVNGDAGVAGLMILSLLAFAHLWRDFNWRWAALAGVFGGLAWLTKLPSPLIFGWLIVLAALGGLRFGQGSLRQRWLPWFLALVLAAVATSITFVLLWPAMWVAPLQTLNLMFHESFVVGEVGAGHKTFFLGTISDDPGWGFYPYVIAFRLTPLTVLGLLGLVGWWWQQRHSAEPVSRWLVAALLAYVVYIYLFASISPKKLDRYVMPMIPALILLAAVGWAWLIDRLAHWRGPQWGISVLALVLLLQIGLVVRNYPYVLTFYNPLLGGFERAAQQVPVGWGEGLEQAAAWVNARPNAGELTVSPWYSDMVRPYLNTETTSFSSSGRGQLSADYVFFYVNQVQRETPNPALVDYFRRQTPVFEVAHRGEPYVWVYAAPAMQVEASGSPRIEGRARLLGYSWHSVPTIGRPAELTLYLHSEGVLPDNESFDVVLEDAAGQIWGTWQGGPHRPWQDEAIIEWQGTLTVPPDTPPGGYRLVVRLLDLNLGSEVTRFDLDEAEVRLDE